MSIVLDAASRRRVDKNGFLIVTDNPIAKAGVFEYSGETIGLKGDDAFKMFKVYRSIDELKTALADSVDDYLELCKEVGKKPEKPFSGRFNIRISPELHQQISKRAADTGMSLNSWIVEYLKLAVQ